MKYVILKKIDNVWYATRNRYTAKELEILVDKLYNDIVDFEVIDDGACQGLDDGVIIVKDDGRELNNNGVYLTDDLTKETTTTNTTNNNHYGLFAILFFMVWFALGIYGVLFLGAVFVIAKVYNNYVNTDEITELPEDHKPVGMM